MLLGSTVLPSAAFAAPGFTKPVEPQIQASRPGRSAVALDSSSPAEIVTFEPGVAPLLLSLPPEAEVRISDWPIAPEVRADVVLTRREIYSPEARVFRVDGKKLTEVPRSKLVFFWGEAEVDGDTRVLVSVDPATGRLQGFSQSLDGIQELRPQLAKSGQEQRYMVASSESFLAAAAVASGADEKALSEPSWSCGEEELPRNLAQATEPSKIGSLFDAAITSLHTSTIAVDTDNEFMQQKFADNTASATNYIANLFAAMNVIYERDLLIRLLQGTTFLRVSSTPDPYTSPTGPDTGPKLTEFANYWRTNHAGVTRALAMQLSGKSSSSNSAAGVAWVNQLCNKTYGYSFSQVFKFAADTSASDAGLVGHELGHNFGSPHTHCYNPPIDTCYAGEASLGCYGGATSCPAATTINGVTNVRGTLMSYCHQLGGCGKSNVFHPRSIELIQPLIQNAVNACVFPLVTGPTVASISPAAGSTAGGTAVLITGTNFHPQATTVTIGGVPATGVNVLGPTLLTALTGAHATGTVSVQVTSNGQSGSLSNSYFYSSPPTTSSFYTLQPCRVLDTRNANGPLGGPALAPSAVRTFDLTGPCGIPNTAKAVSANVTVVTPTAAGYLSIFPGNAIPLGTTSLSFRAGVVRANNAMLRLATDNTGTIGVQNGSIGTTHVIIDVNGYFQ
ncbi:MAG TPA: M12 family metallo-peptidase [Thermoanaerobaculia bacterium]|nr:M12 family metallo-peptidase [Thermoanaerobaculia bacterium]